MLAARCCGLLVACLATARAAAPPDAPIVCAPSVNAARKDIYTINSPLPGCAYSVNAKFYDEKRPAGLHLYFGAEGAKDHDDTWGEFEETALKPLNLIGVNMAYKDGDYTRDLGTKVKGARMAAAQVIADYQIAAGRGILACFSAGGAAAALWVSQAKDIGAGFPFCHVAVYSADFSSPPPEVPLSWFVGLGTQEWRQGNGPMSARLRDVGNQMLQLAVKRGGCADVFFSLTAKGHGIGKDEVTISSEIFQRSEVALAPFIAPGEFSASVQKYVDGANARALGATLTALDKAIDAPRGSESERVRLTDLHGRVAARAALLLDLVDRLSDRDPWLAGWYAHVGQQQLGRHDKAKEFAAKIAALGKSAAYVKAAKQEEAFAQAFPSLFQNDPTLTASGKDLVGSLAATAPDGSLLQRMARGFCVLPAH